MNRPTRPLLWRLGVPVALLLVIVFVLLGLFAWSHSRQTHAAVVHEHLCSVTTELSTHYAPLLGDAQQQQSLQQNAMADGKRLGMRVTIVLPDGTAAADSMMNPADMTNLHGRAEIVAAARDGTGWNVREAAGEVGPFVFVARRLNMDGKTVGFVRVSQSIEGYRANAAAAVRGLAIACVLCILLTFGIIYIADRRLAAQVDGLTARMARFATGDFSRRGAIHTTSGLSTLSDALQSMANQLNERLEELQLQQQQQRAILQSMNNAVLAVDSEQRIVMVNRASEQLLNLQSAKVQGRLLQEVIRQPELHGFVRRALEDPAPQQMELRLMGDPTVVVQATSGPLTTSDDEPAGVLLVLNDVTELRRLESLRSDFAANVSHELRTPITNLKGYVETLLEVGTSDYPQTQKFLGIIQSNVERLSAIVNDVMVLTELERPRIGAKERGRERLERVPSSVQTIMNNVIEQFRPRAKNKNIDLKSRIGSDLRANVQSRLIEQAVGNLVSNAIAYSPQHSTVTIETERRGDEVEIAVLDEGPGIEAEHLPRLWERFYRVDQARSRDAGGTGLGLAIVKHIAISHGGRVEVVSELGKGSRFVIILPIN